MTQRAPSRRAANFASIGAPAAVKQRTSTSRSPSSAEAVGTHRLTLHDSDTVPYAVTWMVPPPPGYWQNTPRLGNVIV